MKLVLKIFALIFVAFSFSILPLVLAIVFFNSLWLWFYVPVLVWALYMIYTIKDDI